MSSFLSRMARKTGNIAKSAGHVVASTARTVTKNPIIDVGMTFIPGGSLVNAGLHAATGDFTGAAIGLIPGGAITKTVTKGVAKMGIGTLGRAVGKTLWANKGKIAGVVGAVGAAKVAKTMVSGGGGGGPTPSMPMLPAMASEDMGNQHAGPSGQGLWGMIPWWKGPGGRLQFPWNDPSAPNPLKQFALDDSYLKLSYRAPKGYVVIRDSDGNPLPVLKMAAQKMGYWHPHKKPPISVGEWHAIKKADSAVRKMRKILHTTTSVAKHVHRGKVRFQKKGGK
jgi:hypothetical protein